MHLKGMMIVTLPILKCSECAHKEHVHLFMSVFFLLTCFVFQFKHG